MALHGRCPSRRLIARLPAAGLMFGELHDSPARVSAQVNFQIFRLIDLPEIEDLTRSFPFNLLGATAIVVSLVVFWLALIWGSGVERFLVIAVIIGLWAFWGYQSLGLS